ncbi:hypothetical protein ACF1G5_00685 [Streptomyces coeruleorubidus]
MGGHRRFRHRRRTLIAGLLLESFSRQSTFLINVPVIVLTIAGTFFLAHA